MKLPDTKSLIKQRISLGVNHCLKSLEEVLAKDSLLFNEFLTYKSKYNDLKNMMAQNLLTYDQMEQGLSKIRVGLLRLIDRIAESDLLETDQPPSLRNSEIQYRKNNFFKLLEIHFENLESINLKLTNSSSDAQSVEEKTGRDAFDFIYREIFSYNFKNPRPNDPFIDDIVGFSDYFFFGNYRRFEVYMKTVKLILNYIVEEEMERDFYIEVMKSVLSTPEMQCIFYYALSDKASDLKSVLIKTQLLEELRGQLLHEKDWDHWK